MKLKNIAVALLSLVLLAPVGGGAVLADNHQDSEPEVDTAAVDFRAGTDHLFSEHAYLIITAMRKAYNGDPDAAEALEAVYQNGYDIQAAITKLYGEEAGETFIKNWTDHIGYFMEYAEAVANGNEEERQKAFNNLKEYTHLSGEFQERLTNGRVTEETVVNVLTTHINQITGSYDAYVAEDYEEAYTIQSEAMEHLVNTVSKSLSKAYTSQFAEMFNHTEAVTEAANLRSDFNFLLAEHFALLQQAMQNNYDDAPGFEANRELLNANTEQLATAIASIYGEAAGEKFYDIWSNHISYFMNYAEATAAGDAAAKEEALAQLEEYREDFSQFISAATEDRVEAETLSQGLQVHVEQALGTFNSYVEGDYEQTWAIARDGYAHMFIPAKLLSSAIVQQFPEMFDGVPGMPETGMGGTADSNNLNWILWALPVLALAGITVFTRRKQVQ